MHGKKTLMALKSNDLNLSITALDVRVLWPAVVGAFILLIPAILNGYPFVFYDTAHYVQVGRSILTMFDIQLPLVAIEQAGEQSFSTAVGSSSPSADDGFNMSLTYIGGRSPYYSLALTTLAGLTGMWGVALGQSLIGSWLLYLTWRTLGPKSQGPHNGPFYLLIVSLTVLSSLPYFVSFSMPDVFAAYAILSVFLTCFARPGRTATYVLAFLTAFSALAHASIMPLVIITGAMCAVWLRGSGQRWSAVGRILLPTILASCATVTAIILFAAACRLLLGDVPRSPPYLLARVLADGPGRTFLADACRDDRFAICAYKDRPLDDHNEILWSTDPQKGVFFFADYPTRIRMSDEQIRFVVGAIAADPVTALSSAAKGSLGQLFTLGIGPELGATKASWDTMVSADLPRLAAEVEGSRSYRGLMPFGAIDFLITISFTGAAFVIWFWLPFAARRSAGRSKLRDLSHAALGLAALIVINAMICGTLSGITNRYQARIHWLVPALALISLMSARNPQRPKGSAIRSGLIEES